MKQEDEVDHIVMFPFMAKGHTIPLLHLAAALSTTVPNLHITFITTPANAPFLRRSLPESDRVTIILLPFPSFPPLPTGVESTDSLPSFSLFPVFLAASSLLRHPFDSLLTHLSRRSPTGPPLCLISDFFFGWTLDACNRLGIPRVVFHGMSPFSMAMCKSLWLHLPNMDLDLDLQQPFHVPGTPTSLLLTKDEIPDSVLMSTDPDDPGTKFLADMGESDVSSWGVLVNSFEDVEGQYAKLFESFYHDGARAWLVGPLCLFSDQSSIGVKQADDDGFGVMEWLDAQEGGSVVYVSFGTQAEVPDEQLDEVAFGLSESGHRFLWTVRSETWAPPEGLLGNSGVVVKWAPQMAVLRHGAVGGFVSHCGWNSVMEGASAGVPMLAWPMIAEQPLNARMVAEELRVGMRLVKKQAGEAIIGRERVRDGVRMLMRDEGVRMRAKELGEMARKAVEDGGSSRRRLSEMLEELRKCRRERKSGSGGESGDGGGGEVVSVEALQFEFCPGQGIQIA